MRMTFSGDAIGLGDATLHRRLWRLLGAFEFIGGQSRESITKEIDQLLMAIVDRTDLIPRTRAELAQSLIERAAGGNAEITASELLAEHGLNAEPLTSWSRIRRNSRDELLRVLENRGYNIGLDVRIERAQSIASIWSSSPRTLVVTGESGQGKTWTMASIATCSSHGTAPVLWVEASGNAREDLEQAAHQFWLDMRGGEQPLPLRQISSRLNTVVPSPENLRLRLCLDNVNNYNEAASIVRENWPSLGVSVAMSCPSEVASSLQEAFHDRVFVEPCVHFSWEELHDLLKRQVGDAWAAIREDVRETLRCPLLASIYLDEFEAEWRPTNEYELFAKMWQRLFTGQQAAYPFDETRMESLADTVLNGEHYPWTLQQLLDCGIDNGTLQRLERCGWLTRIGDNRIRVFHDRLLNWAVAQSLFSSLQSGRRSVDDFVVQVAELNRRDGHAGQFFLGYVPMDVLWLVSGDSELATNAAPRLLETLEPSYGHQPELLYRELVPTLGERIADPLFARFCQFEGYPWVLTEIARTLAEVGKCRIVEFARSLLTDVDPRRQRRGLKLLRHACCPELLDEIWQIHARGTGDPVPFLDEGEKDWLFREDSWPALRKSTVNDPTWIVRQINQADRNEEPVHDLTWLIVYLADGRSTWNEVKDVLFQRVSVDHSRVLAKCIGQFRDREYVDWLTEKLSEDRGMCGPVALQSLSRIDPVAAAESVNKVDQRDLYLTTSWSFREVWLRQPEALTNYLLVWADDVDDPWKIGLLFRHHPNDVPPDLLGRMLDQLDKRLAEHLTTTESKAVSFYRELDFLANVVSPQLVRLLERKRGTPFESNLTEHLRRAGPQRGVWFSGHEREPGFRILRRINGNGFTSLVNEFLQCDDRYGRDEAFDWAIKNPDSETFPVAADRAQSDELWENHPLEQNHAIRLLAVHEQWEAAAMGVCRWGLKTHVELTHDRLVPQEYSAEWLEHLREQVKTNPTPGNVMGLAFAGSTVDISTIHDILASNATDADLRHACIVGLEMLEDDTDEGVRLVARHFDNHRYSVTRMLSQAGTPAAWGALWQDLQKHFDHITALNLMNLSTHADEVLELTTRKLPNQSSFGDWDLLRILILRLRPELKQRLLENPWLRESFHRQAVAGEGSSWLVGSKAGAIECLAEFDPKAAYEAAAQALCTVQWHDRERYPYLLFKIDSKRAVTALLDHLDSEKHGSIRFAIGRVLSGVSLTDVLASRWGSPSPQVRASACFASSWADDGAQLEPSIRRCLDDSSEVVIKAAIDALNRLRQRQLASELRECVASAEGLVVKWRYLDDMIDCIDPGDDFEPWPQTLRSVCDGLSPIILKLTGDRLKKRKKKLHDELKKEKHDE